MSRPTSGDQTVRVSASSEKSKRQELLE